MAKAVASHALEWAEHGQNSGAVLLTAQRLLALQQAISKQLPAVMRQGFAVAQVKGTELTLIADHAALAAKLRQLQPTLLRSVQAAGWNADSLKIKVATRPNIPPSASNPKQARPLDMADLNHFESLRSQVQAGPLADAITRLLAHHKAGGQKN
ncbi:MAG: DUF721 domain-containing protein [Burkholderiaceae bacterium]|nr:DUF721 domain-containing protein [Burkholderiaceae bacterium]MCD8515860.1 DUF721 domain-containing protein [Burkholderiaceae bacterium]MCD8536945.1 DUF721 domain-containing protein [Burkholderiaceae bacterium]MCD8565726.1 DUF721 domain-containing protein [Burkholderiaceae bacterium]